VAIFNCLRCGETWVSDLVKPRFCPTCKSPGWDREPRETYQVKKLKERIKILEKLLAEKTDKE